MARQGPLGRGVDGDDDEVDEVGGEGEVEDELGALDEGC